MKKVKVVILFAVLAGMSSCLVSSLHPFYKAEDKCYNPVMEGTWLDEDSCLWVIEAGKSSEGFMGPDKHDSSYVITYYEEPDKKALLRGTLFRLNDIDYVDFTPNGDEDQCITDMACWHHVPVHTLARIRFDRDSLMIYWYGDDWLNELFEEQRIRIRHEKLEGLGYDRNVLTADTDELQKFIRKFASDRDTEAMVQNIFAKGNADGDDDSGVFLKLNRIENTEPGS